MKIKIQDPSVDSYLNKSGHFVQNRKNWVVDEDCEKNILILIFGTFLEVGQPIPNIRRSKDFSCQRSFKNLSYAYKV